MRRRGRNQPSALWHTRRRFKTPKIYFLLMTSKPPFTLPDVAVDLYEVKWFELESFADHVAIRSFRAIYHVNRKWSDLYPDNDEGQGPGADFVDHWQLFDGDRFCGRSHQGWEAVLRADEWNNVFGTIEEAKAAAVTLLLKKIELVTAHKIGLKKQLKRLTDE